MSTSKPHNEEGEIKLEITETSQDEAPTQQEVQKIIQNPTDLFQFQSDEQASSSEPQKYETETSPIDKPIKRRLKKEKVPLTENEKLIQLVRCMRCLYDPEHPRHRDTQVRRDLWDIIGNAMDLPGDAYLEDWQTLIDKFITSKSKNKNKDFNDLKWLLRCICKEEAELKVSEIDSQKKNSSFNEEATFLHAKDCQCNTAALAHPMQKFLAEIATKLKKLPKQEQNLAKLEIFEIIHKFDLIKSTELTVTEIKTDIDID